MTKDRSRDWLELACFFEEKGEYYDAFINYTYAAKDGNNEAKVNLGVLYCYGKGCEKDIAKAIYWYKSAVRSGSEYGAYNLGALYRRNGNVRWAKYWFHRAVIMGDTDALSDLDELNLMEKKG